MDILFEKFQIDYGLEVEKMIINLYKEDPEGESITREKIGDTFKQVMSFPEKCTIVVFKSSKDIVGYALLVFYWSNEYGGDILNIDELYVKSDWRGKGIASQFFKYLNEKYDEKVAAFGLEVTPSNKKALNYYKNLGFHETENSHLIKN
ncbi:GNAT family N-acetyltransferase [Wukongibacter baidiensis]|uniref:GNAT family N-acetyltransferase n=1 Tax=Wukongibacter baidiensis TaxID=1723361 RepID=UPI003D7F3E32